VHCDKSIRKPEIILKYINKLLKPAEDSEPITLIVSDPAVSEYG